MKRARQAGAISLTMVALISCAVAGLAMLALLSWRNERDLLAPTLESAVKQGDAVLKKVADAAAPGGGELRQCLIGGKKVVSNTQCADANPSTRRIDIVDTRGFVPPKPAPPPPAPAPQPRIHDKMIEEQAQ